MVEIALRVGIEIGEPVEALRPRTLQIVAKAKAHCQRVAHMPGVVEIESSIHLLAGGERRDNGLGKKMIFEVAEVVSISQKEVGEGKSSEAGLARRTKIEGAAGYIRLRVVLVSGFELQAKMIAVASAHERKTGG